MPSVTTDTVLLRAGGIAALLGALLAIGANVLHPAGLGTVGPGQSARLIADHAPWVGSSVGALVAVLLLTGALVALTRSLEGRAGAPWARLGQAAALIGAAVFCVLAGSNGLAMKLAAQDAVHGGTDPAWAVFRTLDAVNFSLLSVAILVYFGVGFGLVGVAVARDTVYPRWLGWVAIVGALICFVAGVESLYRGPNWVLMGLVFPIGSGLLMLWMLAIGLAMLQLARLPGRAI
ncbi:MAG TPA: DUF4386 family protein [bacterium]|nr:DUF4386 family protein [bacterium]